MERSGLDENHVEKVTGLDHVIIPEELEDPWIQGKSLVVIASLIYRAFEYL